jgi:5-methylcytosine-specific restriction endonuclease McrA
MPERTCSVDGCCAPHRARGFCSTHYNSSRYTPEQRWSREVACFVCGEKAIKLRGQNRSRRAVCSMYCRWFLQNPVLSCPIPSTHPAHPDYLPPGPSLAVIARVTRKAEVARLMEPRNCDDCGEIYSPGTTVQRYCSARCLRRVGRRRRKALEHGAQGSYTWTQVIGLFRLFDRRCAYCAEPIDGQPDPDHVVPLARHGHNGISNILPSCRDCNCDKRDLPIEDWNVDRERRGLPARITQWDPLDARYVHLSPALDQGLLTVTAA